MVSERLAVRRHDLVFHQIPLTHQDLGIAAARTAGVCVLHVATRDEQIVGSRRCECAAIEGRTGAARCARNRRVTSWDFEYLSLQPMTVTNGQSEDLCRIATIYLTQIERTLAPSGGCT